MISPDIPKTHTNTNTTLEKLIGVKRSLRRGKEVQKTNRAKAGPGWEK